MPLMSRTDVVIKTRDGNCPASLFTPAGTGPWPAVVFYMDGLGIRPALWDMAQQLADTGYVVLLPDLYYREGGYEQMVPAEVFADPKQLENLIRMIGTLSRDRKVSDSAAFIEFLKGRAEVKGERFGGVGYCMGGNVALTVAGEYKDAFAGIASFHAGGLATDQPDSPHLFVKGITGRVYVAGAVEDGHFTDAQKAELGKALTVAGVEHIVETYAGAHHGFAVPDHPAFNVEAAERHRQALAKLFGEALAA
jgi:carboxymethylenebutenolidase